MLYYDVGIVIVVDNGVVIAAADDDDDDDDVGLFHFFQRMEHVLGYNAVSMPSAYMPRTTQENVCVTKDIKEMDRIVLVSICLWHNVPVSAS